MDTMNDRWPSNLIIDGLGMSVIVIDSGYRAGENKYTAHNWHTDGNHPGNNLCDDWRA